MTGKSITTTMNETMTKIEALTKTITTTITPAQTSTGITTMTKITITKEAMAKMTGATTMTEIPERIWACMGGPMVGLFVSGGNNGGWPEYVREDRVVALTAERDGAINQLDSAIHSQIVLEKRTAAVMEDRKFILEERDRTFALMLARADQLRKLLEAIIDEYNGHMYGPTMHAIEAARSELDKANGT